MRTLPFVFDDGGRKETGRRGTTGDCVARAIAIALGVPYQNVYVDLAEIQGRAGKARTARTFRLPRSKLDDYLRPKGWIWTPAMEIGSGCQVHLSDELLVHAYGDATPMYGDRLIVRLSRHLTAVVEGKIHDTYDPGRDGTRCVYGYWKEERNSRARFAALEAVRLRRAKRL